jgi:large subunit ribosomal protein L12
MEYIYGALTLHASGKEINEENVKKMLQAVGVEIDEAKIRSLVASLQKVNVDEVLKGASAMPVAPAAQQTAPSDKKEEKKEEKSEEKSEEDIASGLGALFG